ncbi:MULTISPECIES: hypothetical protein [Streptomyces]|uniref:hypothetical protein n=1 Tax=Streptomyces TaxID=1883 RepID=UPI0004CC9105|nr:MULTISPECIES: hypothetical protein [Streptomyces]
MRLTVSCGARRVDLRIAGDDARTLKAAKRAALSLLAALPEPDTDPAEDREAEPFGFVALSSDTEIAADQTQLDDEDEEECRA